MRKYLRDVLLTIEDIQQLALNWTLDDLNNIGNKWAIERGIGIIGEAIYKANNLNRTLGITDKNKIIATRHIIIHDYDSVDAARLLFIVKEQLPLLKKEVEYIMKNLA